MSKVVNDHELSLRAIGLDCLWITKVRIIMKCLCVPSNLIVSGWRKGETKVVSVDRRPVFDKGSRWPYWSLRVIRLAVSRWRRETKVVSVVRHWVFDKGSRWPYWSLRVIELAVSGWRWKTKVVSVNKHQVFDKGSRWTYWSLHVIRHAVL